MSLSPFRTTPWKLGLRLALLQAILLVVAALVGTAAARGAAADARMALARSARLLEGSLRAAGPDGWREALARLDEGPIGGGGGLHARAWIRESGEPLATHGTLPPEPRLSETIELAWPAGAPAIAIELSSPAAAAAAILRCLQAATAATALLVAGTLGLAYRAARRVSMELDVATAAAAAGRRSPEPIAPEIDLAAASGAEPLAERTRDLERAERHRREQQAILESMRVGLLALDPEQRILRLNRAAAEMLGLAEADVRGRLVQAVARQPGLNRFIADAIDDADAVEGEFTLDRHDGPRMIVQAVSEPLRNSAGEPAGLLVSLTDVTKLRRLESLRQDFVANVSHELRTPITNIKGYVDTLLQVGVQDREQATRFLEIVRRNALRLGAIIEDLLSLARLEQPGARESLEPAEISVREVVLSVREQLEGAASAKSIALEMELPGTLRVRGSPSLLEQAVANLVSNAITYSAPGTTVRVAARQTSERMVEIAVTDQGPGIAPHHLPRIFERFYRVDKARSRDQGGTGLGLAIVKHIALAHGGRVEVESRLGAGSTFRLFLPMVGSATMAQIAG